MTGVQTCALPILLTAARGFLSGTSSATKSYFCGGSTGSVSSIVDAVSFSSGTVADITDLSAARSHVAATNSAQKMYTFGGRATVLSNLIDVMPFATETVAAGSSNLEAARAGAAAASSSVCAYCVGGEDVSKTLNTAESINFATDTVMKGGYLSVARKNLSGSQG